MWLVLRSGRRWQKSGSRLCAAATRTSLSAKVLLRSSDGKPSSTVSGMVMGRKGPASRPITAWEPDRPDAIYVEFSRVDGRIMYVNGRSTKRRGW